MQLLVIGLLTLLALNWKTLYNKGSKAIQDKFDEVVDQAKGAGLRMWTTVKQKATSLKQSAADKAMEIINQAKEIA